MRVPLAFWEVNTRWRRSGGTLAACGAPREWRPQHSAAADPHRSSGSPMRGGLREQRLLRGLVAEDRPTHGFTPSTRATWVKSVLLWKLRQERRCGDHAGGGELPR